MKIYRLVILFLIHVFLFGPDLSSQDDSLWDKGTGEEKLGKLFTILSSSGLQADENIRLALEAREIAQNLNDRKSLCLSYKYLGNGYFLKPDFENAIKIYSVALKLAEELNESSIASDCYYNLSISYQGMGNYAEALKYAKTAFSIDYSRNDSAAMAESYNFIGIIYENLGDYDKALSNYFKSLEIIESRGDETGIARSYNNIGIVFFNLSNYPKAKEYLRSSINRFELLGNVSEKCKPLISMGDLYERIEKYDSALILFNQVLEITNKLGDKSLESSVLSRIGDLYFIEGKYKTAFDYYLKNYELKRLISDYEGMVRARYNMARTFVLQNDYQQALKNLAQAEEYWKEVKSKKILAEIYELYYTIYKMKKDDSKALKYFERFISIKDSIFSENTNNKIYELSTIYETEKKEKENEILRQSNEIQILELERSKTARNLVLIIALSILTFSLILFKRYRTKLKTNAILRNQNLLLENQKSQISHQKAEIEVKNLQITDSIMYASLIQKSMLPKTQILQDKFPDSFILYLPRDIVSGDFYWIMELNTNLVVAVADCTGHGVPAAFMSMLGIEILSEIFENRKILQTDIALHYLRDGVVKALHQDENDNEDGMDVAICIIDKLRKTIEFSGARRPLLYIENGELFEIKGDKLSIGGRGLNGSKFSRHLIPYESGISLYLFSDGYHDQFGGPHNGKISYNLFKELLQLNSEKTMQEQKEYFQDFLLKWKGDTIQIDDILVMGIRLD